MSYDGPKRERDELDGVAPPEFASNLFGHSVVWQRLITQLDKSKLPGGILLHGPRGIGKATLAFQLAKHILIDTGDEPEDRVIQQIEQGAHPNVTVARIDQENGKFKTAISVDTVRKLIEALHQTRGRSGHRVAIIDAAEDCNRNAMNALLKILEEPPVDCHFILVSHQPGRLLPTIRSRCQAHAMRPLSTQELTKLATQIVLDDDGEQITDDAIKMSDGVPRTLYELIALGETEHLSTLAVFLSDPSGATKDAPASLSQAFATKQNAAMERIARTQLLHWISSEAKNAASDVNAHRFRLASAGALWDKANQIFTQTDTYNLDLAATYLVLFQDIQQQAALAQGQHQSL